MTKKRINPKQPNHIAQDQFIAEYFANGGRKKQAAEKLGMGWSTVKEWFQKDANFRDRVEDFRDMWKDNLRAIALKRASEKSDTLLIFLMKAFDPDTYDDAIRKEKWLADRGRLPSDTITPMRALLISEPVPWEASPSSVKDDDDSTREH